MISKWSIHHLQPSDNCEVNCTIFYSQISSQTSLSCVKPCCTSVSLRAHSVMSVAFLERWTEIFILSCLSFSPANIFCILSISASFWSTSCLSASAFFTVRSTFSYIKEEREREWNVSNAQLNETVNVWNTRVDWFILSQRSFVSIIIPIQFDTHLLTSSDAEQIAVQVPFRRGKRWKSEGGNRVSIGRELK